MNKKIQPKIYTNCTVTCACGNTFVTISTEENIKVDICSACHPFYTGKQKFIDTEGRIEKFQKKVDFAKAKTSEKKAKKAKVSGEKQDSAEKRRTLKEMLEEAQKVQG